MGRSEGEQLLEQLALARMGSSRQEQLALARMGRRRQEQLLEQLAPATMGRRRQEQLLEQLALVRRAGEGRSSSWSGWHWSGWAGARGGAAPGAAGTGHDGQERQEQLLEQLALARMGRSRLEQLREQLALARMGRRRQEQLLEQLALARMGRSEGSSSWSSWHWPGWAGAGWSSSWSSWHWPGWAAAGVGQPGDAQSSVHGCNARPQRPPSSGQFGHPVAVPDDKQEEAKSRWKEGNFNVYLSDLIPVDRAITDTRPAGCSEQQVHDDLPTTTIIMCFVDEVWSTLLRSVHSVLSRSPPHLIQEIILVDDSSTKEYLKERLDAYMSRFPKVKILRLKERHGLIRARLAGAQMAKGAVLTFLDSHVECNVGWLEPLLDRIRLRRTKVACPVIEVISDKDMRCPVMAGGLFSIDKKYFFELGTNDNPYSFPKDRVRTVERNLARVAEVWLDEYKELFYGHAYHLLRSDLHVGDLRQQIQLRKKLRCKSFRWYLENVYPDLEAPLVKASGLLVNAALAGCIAVAGTTLAFEECDVNNANQKFNYTWLRLIQHGELCLAPSGVLGAVGLRRCQRRSRSLAWLHRALATVRPGLADHIISEHQHLPQPACLEVDPTYKALRVRGCDSTSPHQKWQFGSYHAD
ncbi:hypothetical protein DUI87_31014 [Hirundo rustica rustica]|uniref:Polypeptide N-acetylgalactosaminyltransferase n=1 Tax=Hirundo rustica rustica TaxID=333673 RepID=A0A3M0IX83_HIRRU|nr:hypothetical protein DUI87_31014 [Hirundo rustica rustica]